LIKKKNLEVTYTKVTDLKDKGISVADTNSPLKIIQKNMRKILKM
jgi:hypothetical protein